MGLGNQKTFLYCNGYYFLRIFAFMIPFILSLCQILTYNTSPHECHPPSRSHFRTNGHWLLSSMLPGNSRSACNKESYRLMFLKVNVEMSKLQAT